MRADVFARVKFMEQQSESEKPFLLQQLLPHGILAAGLLLGGWLMPAQFNILHPKVLRQAGAGRMRMAGGACWAWVVRTSRVPAKVRVSREVIFMA